MSNNPNQSLSIIAIEVNGQKLDTKEVSSFSPGGMMRETQIGDSGISFGEKPKEASVEVTLKILGDTNPSLWDGWDDVTIILTADTGQIYVMANAWLTEPPSISPSDGTASLTFNGNKAVLVG